MGCGKVEQMGSWWGGVTVSWEGRTLCQTCTFVLGQGSDDDGPHGLLYVGVPARRSSVEAIPSVHAENLRNGPLTSKGSLSLLPVGILYGPAGFVFMFCLRYLFICLF